MWGGLTEPVVETTAVDDQSELAILFVHSKEPNTSFATMGVLDHVSAFQRTDELDVLRRVAL